MTSRRGFLLGIGAALAAPAIVRADSLMPVRKLIAPDWWMMPLLVDSTVQLQWVEVEAWASKHGRFTPYLTVQAMSYG